MDLQVTPSQRQMDRAHQTRMDTFWPQRHGFKPAKRKLLTRATTDQGGALRTLTAAEWFACAWEALGESVHSKSVSDVQNLVCEYFDVPLLYMTSVRRNREHYIPRNVAMYLSHKFTDSSYPAIGRMFKRDHTTIISCVKAVEKLIALNHPIATDIEILSAKLKGPLHD